MARKVFISYRRDDSRYQARMIYAAFERVLGREAVFMDVDSIPPAGLYQVHGNVYEWCEDLADGRYDEAPVDGSAWVQGFKGIDATRRRIRGGSWGQFPHALRSASRRSGSIHERHFSQGFRLVRTL